MFESTFSTSYRPWKGDNYANKFYITKEGMIDLYNWIKKEIPDLLFYSKNKNACFDENELYINDVGHIDTLIMTLNDSLLAEKMKDIRQYIRKYAEK